MRDQHQRGRRQPRRRAAVGGITAEQLAQPRVVEVVSQACPQRGEGAEPAQRRQPARPQVADHAQHAWPLRADVRAFQALVDTPRLVAKGQVAAPFGRAGKLRDGVGRSLQVGMQVERVRLARLRAAPGMARQHLQRLQIDQRVERAAGFGQDLVEDPTHREHRRPGVDGRTVDLQLPHLAAGCGRRLDQSDLQPALRQQQGADQPANAGADHHHAVRARRHRLSHGAGPSSCR